MKATQKIIDYKYDVPKNADPEVYDMLRETFDRFNELYNSPIPSNINPNNYTRKIVVKSNIRNKTPNGMFRLFTAGDNPYEESKNMFRLFQR